MDGHRSIAGGCVLLVAVVLLGGCLASSGPAGTAEPSATVGSGPSADGSGATGTDAPGETATDGSGGTATVGPGGTATDGPRATSTGSTLPPSLTGTPPTTAPAGGCVEWVSFWGRDGGNAGPTWSADTVRVGYAVTANASGFLVAFVDGRVAGVASYSTDRDTAYTADGDAIDLRRSLTGTHEVRVLAAADTNGNGEYDPRTDRPCRADGAPVQVGPTSIGFSRFGTESGPA